MRVLMVGVDEQTKGGMWTVVENYLRSESFTSSVNLKYIPTSITGTIPNRLLFTGKALLLIIKELLSCKYDIVHVHMAERGSVYRKNLVMCIAKLFHCKIVLHMHGAEFEPWYNTLSEAKKIYIRRILNKADKLIILGKYWEEFIGSLVESEEKICTVHNAVSVPNENRYNMAAKNLLFLGVVGKRKGIYDLLQAMKQIDTQLSEDVKLIIYGPDSEGRIHDTIEQMRLSERVFYKGWLNTEERNQVFAEVALNILPSYNEGLPMTILECMSYGIPNISTNVAAIPEAVNNKNGILIAPGDIEQLGKTINFLMSNDVERSIKSAAAYSCAKDSFSVSVHFERIMNIYRELSGNNV